MKTYFAYLNEMTRQVERQHSGYNIPVNWFHPYRSFYLEEKKEELISKFEKDIQWCFRNTKPWINSLSPGCRICGEGEWSCLFVTGKCNAGCFYCPSSQNNDEIPQTQKLVFDNPAAYADYINQFQFKGVSFSGGEPLLFFDRTVNYLKSVRKKCAPSLYSWMYTNGILAADEKFKKLTDAGLDEIRFDLGAVNYNPNVLKNAARFIKNVTVEIPAVPEDVNKLKEVIPVLCDYGVTRLNLHQLRLTQYNAPKLLPRGYTFMHGEQPVVIESEITALEIIGYVAENKLPIGVNYCNFQFKNRFQKAGFRRKMAEELKSGEEEITENGYLRKIEDTSNEVSRTISISDFIANRSDIQQIRVTYAGRILENLNLLETERKFEINNLLYPVAEGPVTEPIILSGILIDRFLEIVKGSEISIPNHPALFEAWRHECIEEGMRSYF